MVLLVPFSASALVPAGELAGICASHSPVCRGFTLGAAERYWLLNNTHKKCNTQKDMKDADALMDAVDGEGNIYSKADAKSPAAYTVLSTLLDSKLKQCTLGLKFSTLLEKCRAKLSEENMACEAYLMGALDMTQTLQSIKQTKDKKESVAVFCAKGASKDNFSVEEIKLALTNYAANHPKKMDGPAAQEVVNALLNQYPCTPNNTDKK